VKFWDASAIVPLLVTQPGTVLMQQMVDADPEMAVWWGTPVECASALARLERAAELDPERAAAADRRLQHLIGSWIEIEPSEMVRETAIRFLRVHPLRAADALQLAAAFVAAANRPSTLGLVTLDGRLADAARKEGFMLPVSAA
jgi:uncharacterized protein